MNPFLLQQLMGQLPGMGLFGPMQGGPPPHVNPAQPTPAPSGPQRPVTAPPQAPPQPQPASTPLQRLLGVDPTRMSPEATQRRQALGMIAAGSQLADDPGNFMGGVGRAVMTGRGTVQGLEQQARQQKLQSQLGQLGPDELQRGFQMALAQGDLETANAIRQMIATQAAQTAQKTNDEFTLSPGSARYRRNPETGEVEEIASVPFRPRTPPSYSLRDMVMPDGTIRTVGIDPKDPTRQVDVGQPVPSTDQRQAEAFATLAVSADDVFNRLEAQGFEPGLAAQLASDLLPDELQPAMQGLFSSDQQEFNSAKDEIAEAFLRPVTGARINQDETARAIRMMVPLPNEAPAQRQAKAARRARWVELMSRRSGQPARFESATEAMDEVFGEGTGTEEEVDLNAEYEEWLRKRRGE